MGRKRQRHRQKEKAKRMKLGNQDILDKKITDKRTTSTDRMSGNRSGTDYEEDWKRLQKRAKNRRKRHNYARNVKARRLRLEKLERELQGQSSTGDFGKYKRI